MHIIIVTWIVFFNAILFLSYPLFSNGSNPVNKIYLKYLYLLTITLIYWKLYEMNLNFNLEFTGILIFFLTLILVFNVRKKINIKEIYDESFINLLVIINSIVFIFAYFISTIQIPVFIDGNNDIWLYSKYANILTTGEYGNNFKNLNLRGLLPNNQTPLAFLLIGGIAKISSLSIIESLQPTILTPLILSSCIIFHISKKYFAISEINSILISLCWATSGFIVYIIKNYFLGQALGISFFLLVCFIINNEDYSKKAKVIIISVLWYLIFLSYQLFTVVYIFIIGIALLLIYLNKNLEKYKNNFYIFIYSLLLFIGAVLLINFEICKIIFSRIIELNSASAGWPFPIINFLSFMPGPLINGQISSPHTTVNIFGIISINVFIWVLTLKKSEYKEKYIFYLVLFSISSSIYIVYFLLKGISYQQWKFGASVLLPLTFIPLAVIVGIFSNKYNKYFLAFLLLINISFIYIHKQQNNMSRFLGLDRLVEIDNSYAIENVVINLQDDYVGTMIAQQFINKKSLFLISPSYLTGFVPENKDIFTLTGNPQPDKTFYVFNNCTGFNLSNVVRFSLNYCGTYGLPLVSNSFSVYFNAPLPYYIRPSGLSVVEPWGRWVDGEKVGIYLTQLKPLSVYSVKVNITARDYKNKCRKIQINDGSETHQQCIIGLDIVNITVKTSKTGEAFFEILDTTPMVASDGEDKRDLRFNLLSMEVSEKKN